MSIVIGIDVGGSRTKIVGFDNTQTPPRLITPLSVNATDPITSVYGAFGKFTSQNSLALSDIDRVMITGVGSAALKNKIYSLNCEVVPEFQSIGLGGLYLSGLDSALVVSMGTGTANVFAKRGEKTVYLGGTGVGGGTLIGLSKKLLGMDNVEHIESLAKDGDLSMIDLKVSDIAKKNISLPTDMTAANFGKISDIASRADVALGIINMILETIGMVAIFAARSQNTSDIVLTGNMTNISMCGGFFANLSKMFDINFIIPENAQYATVIGAALLAL